MDGWLALPEGVLLSLRQQTAAGERSQWAVVTADGSISVHYASSGDNNWSELSNDHNSLESALKGVPGLCAVHRGAISEYTLDRKLLQAGRFVQLLDLCPSEGNEDPGDWPPDVASEWEWLTESMERYSENMLLRWATINGDGMWITGVHGRTFSQVAIDEAEGGCPDSLAEIARCWWAVDNTGAPISWAGGYLLNLVALGLACSYPYNDEAELAEDSGYQFIQMPEEPNETAAEIIAQWIIDHDAEVGAALSFEEFDPDNTLGGDERETWESAMRDIELGVSANGCGGLLRERIAERSQLYRDTRDALVNPCSALGRRLLAAYEECSIYIIRDGSWASGG